MKYVKVHDPIQVYNLVTGTPVAEPVYDEVDGNLVVRKNADGDPVLKVCEPWSFYNILVRFVFPDKKLNVKGKALSKMQRRLTKAFKNAKTGDVVLVDDADLDAVKKLCEDNEWGPVNGQLGDFFDSIDNATDDPPT